MKKISLFKQFVISLVCLMPTSVLAAGIDEAKFNLLVDEVINTYKPIVSKHGGKLTSEKKWDEDEFMPGSDRRGTQWIITVTGGLARFPTISEAGFTAAVCHEVGHHLGGFPFYDEDIWASSDGQADYWTSHACLPKLWKNQLAVNAMFRGIVTPQIQKKCDLAWNTQEERDLCYRITEAVRNGMESYAAYRGWITPSFERPDPYNVSETFPYIAKAQCRMDIQLAGALCPLPWNDNVIPGLGQSEGNNSLKAERIASLTSCHPGNGWLEGAYPKCWFKPSYQFLALKAWPVQVTNQGNTFDIKVPLSNRSTVTTSKIVGTLAYLGDNSKVELTRSQVNYSDIAAGDTGFSTLAFQAKVRQQSYCGEKFNFRVEWTGENANAPIKLQSEVSFNTGKYEDVFQDVSNKVIPIPVRGVATSSLMVASVKNKVTRATVAAKIQHEYGRDVHFFLVAPSGKEIYLTDGEDTPDDEFSFEKTVDIGSEDADGIWKLIIVDDMEASEGELKTWSLKLKKSVCE